MMKLTYIYHSGFALEAPNFNVIFDYYKDGGCQDKIGELLEDEKKLYVLASHSHHDHFNPEVLQWRKRGEQISYMFSSDIADFRALKHPGIHYLSKGDNFSDSHICLNTFGSTDAGVSFLVEAGGKKIFHAGDLNNWHWRDESSTEEADEAERAYMRELEDIYFYADKIDLIMFPLDARMGKDFAHGAEQFLNMIKVKYFAPMHFTYPDAGMKKALEFKSFAESKGAQFISWANCGDYIKF